MTVRTRSPRRRLAAVVSLGALAVTLMTGCQSEPGTAAYIGKARISERQVDAIYDSLPVRAGAEGPARMLIIQSLVFTTIAEQYARDRGIDPPVVSDSDYQQYAAQAHIAIPNPQHNAYVRTVADAAAWQNALITHTAPANPTNDQLLFAYNNAISQHLLDPAQQPFEATKPAITAIEGFTQAAGLETDMHKWLDRRNVVINPRYTTTCPPGQDPATPCLPFSVPLLYYPVPNGGPPLEVVALPVGPVPTTPIVVDAPPTPVAPAPAATDGQPSS